MIIINQKLMLTYEYEPIVNFRQDIVSYELIIRPLASPDYDEFIPDNLFSGVSQEKKIEVFNDQLLEVKRYQAGYLIQNIKIIIKIDDDLLNFLAENHDVLREVSELSIISFQFHEVRRKKQYPQRLQYIPAVRN
ncbi:hypothetical protein [Pantoea sp. App145]|uniref:hypothetical protein n=1 Tax=Pantoea sp. App145 TaxID=3071567 RepID=UPI003A7FFA4E